MLLRAEEIKPKARALGFDRVGIVPATVLSPEDERLCEWLPWAAIL